MDTQRKKRFNTVLQHLVADFFIDIFPTMQQDFGIITINKVALAKDFSYLDIFVSSLLNHEKLCHELAKHAQILKRHINQKITLRKTPIIRFRYDDNMKQEAQLLHTIA